MASVEMTGVKSNPFEIEEGKFYVTRDGEKVGPAQYDGIIGCWHVGPRLYIGNGRPFALLSGGPNAHDIVAEWEAREPHVAAAICAVQTSIPNAANDNDPAVSPADDGHNPKRRFGVTKPSMQFVPPAAMIEEAVVMALGASKYGPFNWNDIPVDASTYYSAIMRHMLSWFAGEDKDPESGASHLAHVRACCGILIDANRSGNLIDDRPKCASAAAAISEMTKRDQG